MESQQNQTERTERIFQDPPAQYRSAPFWGWDGDLRKEELERQIEIFKKMGFGGFHMHARAGLITPYLSDQFMQCVKDCCQKAEEEGMYAWLYDEDRYPSGPAGGIVTRNPDYTRRYVRFTPFAYGEKADETVPSRGFARNADGQLLARYEISLDDRGDLAGYRRLAENEVSGDCWYAYFEKQPATTDENQTYVDTLNPQAIRKFAEVTYDRYKESVGKYFGNVSPAMFTDEPQFASMSSLSFAAEKQDVIIPWTNGFGEAFAQCHEFDILDRLPELVWNLPQGDVSRARYLYHDFLAERFVSAYCDTLGKWCEENGIMFTGHIMGEGTLKGQSAIAGDIMRCYRAFQLPGIDVLGTHKLEFTTAKQAQSAVRQQGSAGMMSELYGASGWDFDFRGYKLQGDWQAAMGVTLRVPHHALYTFNGESKRDYPASISYQSGWWEKFHLIEDHFARLNTALTKGTPQVRIGVIHPLESVWLNMGPNDRSSAVIARYERNFQELIEALVYRFLDFDLICEARLSDLCPQGGAPLRVGRMAYDAVIIPGLETLRQTTLERLEQFQAGGGRLIFMGSCPRYLDGERSERIQELYARSETMDYDVNSLTDALAEYSPLQVSLPDGSGTRHLIHQLRRDGEDEWLFLATTRRQPSPDVDIPNQAIKFNVGQKYETEVLRFEIKGGYALEEYDTQSGRIRKIPARYVNGRTVFRRRWHMHDSLLLKMMPGRYEGEEKVSAQYTGGRRIFSKVPVTLSEPNVYLLDLADYALDGGTWRPQEELLKLENICRTECGLPIRKRAIPQPYQMRREPAAHRIRLRFDIESRLRIEDAVLAMESMEESEVWWNGKQVRLRDEGWFIDPVIRKAALPPIEEGVNRLEVELPLGLNTKLEYLYLLGDFGVSVSGCCKTIAAPVRELAFGSWTTQGLPFYSGSVTYHMDMECNGATVLRVPHYRGAMMEVSVDSQPAGEIIYSPYALELPRLDKGGHRFDVTLYATRQNTLAALHHLSSIPFAQGPDSWRSTDDLWNYEYSFTPQGIISSPRFYDLSEEE